MKTVSAFRFAGYGFLITLGWGATLAGLYFAATVSFVLSTLFLNPSFARLGNNVEKKSRGLILTGLVMLSVAVAACGTWLEAQISMPKADPAIVIPVWATVLLVEFMRWRRARNRELTTQPV